MKDKNTWVGTAFLLLGLLLSAGTAWWFPVCRPMEDGKWMKCHWSSQAIIGIGVVLLVLAAAYLLAPQRLVRAGLSLAAVPLGFFTLAVLYGLIGLCPGAEMPCRALTQPAVTITSAVLIVLAGGNSFWLLRTERKTAVPKP